MSDGYDPEIPSNVHLHRIARELTTIRQLVATAVNHMVNAEAEIPEKMRRFTHYMHDVHDIKFMYEELGHSAPDYLHREMERLDDRYRQLLKECHLDGGTFEKVRREMASDPENRWDHTRLLFKTKETVSETRQSIEQYNERTEEGAEPTQSESGSSGPNGSSPSLPERNALRREGF